MKQKANHISVPKRQGGLSEDDQQIWHQVRKTVEPLHERDHGRTRDLIERAAEQYATRSVVSNNPTASPADLPKRKRQYPVASYAPPLSKKEDGNPTNSAIDDKTARRLLKGKISVDARIDLHGMTQGQAHRALLRFLAHSHGAGDRMVLVITGKGRMSEGILRQSVPNWLRESALSIYVSAFRTAHITHGGEGALYVRLRKRNDRQRGGGRSK